MCPVAESFNNLQKYITSNCKFIVFQIDKVVRSNFLTLVVQLTISFILSFITQVHTTGTGSDLSRKVWVTAYKGDTYWAVSL